MNAVSYILCFLCSYLLGAVPWGYLLVRWRRGIDIRKKGSGNIGFTNVLRTATVPLAVTVLILDAGKGAAAVGIIAPLCDSFFPGPDPGLVGMIAFLGAVTGHIFPVFLSFRGGKGVAAAAGALAVYSPAVLLICLGVWLVLVVLTRRVSPGSIASAAVMAPLLAARRDSIGVSVSAAVIALLIIWRHRENIGRLLAGTEPTIRRGEEKT